MPVKTRLILLNFLQFFIFGSWLITIGNYWFGTKQWLPEDFGLVFSTLGISSIVMPALMGIVADRWMSAERLYGILHLVGGVAMLCLPQVNTASHFFVVILVGMLCYMPTISLACSISFSGLKSNGLDVVSNYPPIRIWGTIGFILAMWTINLSGFKASANQFYIAGGVSFLLAFYAFSLPRTMPCGVGRGASLTSVLGLDAFRLFKNTKMALFFIFSIFLGASLQLTNMYGDRFLSSFADIPIYADSFVVKYSTIIMSISQISEALFILAIPFFLKRFGIKMVILMSMVAWALRFGLFAFGDPAESLWMIILSCIIYGLAFDFFNISGSLFVETQCDSSIRSSAQGLFMMMTNGVGAVLGAWVSGQVIARFFSSPDGHFDWLSIWGAFAIYSLVLAVLFALFFKHKHKHEWS